MTTTADNERRALANRHVAVAAFMLHAELSASGFRADTSHMVSHQDSGVAVATTVDGYRITYPLPDVGGQYSLGIVELPPSVAPAEVAHVALSLHLAAASECVPCLAETAPHTCGDED